MSELDDFFNTGVSDVPDESGASELDAVERVVYDRAARGSVPDKPSTPLDTLKTAIEVLKEAARWTDGEVRADIERARERIEKILEDST